MCPRCDDLDNDPFRGRTQGKGLGEQVVHRSHRIGPDRTVNERSSIDMGLITGCRATTFEGGQGLISVDDQDDLDETCTGIDRDPLQLVDELHACE